MCGALLSVGAPLLRLQQHLQLVLLLPLMRLGGLLTVRPQAQTLEGIRNLPLIKSWLVACLGRA